MTPNEREIEISEECGQWTRAEMVADYRASIEAPLKAEIERLREYRYKLLGIIDTIITANDLPGDHCELEQAMVMAREELDLLIPLAASPAHGESKPKLGDWVAFRYGHEWNVGMWCMANEQGILPAKDVVILERSVDSESVKKDPC
jgi:hypothetical protein